MKIKKKVLLTILDGFGIGEKSEFNAVKNAETPEIDKLFEKYPSSELICSGAEVGLPDGTMGNSEVGHLNIGAGRVIFQDISRIDNSIRDGSFYENEVLNNLIDYVKENPNRKLHILGLLSDGRVHSSFEHLEAIVKSSIKKNLNKDKVNIHIITDGRDTPPNSAINFVKRLEDFLEIEDGARIASVSGRFYSMDRDKRWERVKKAYNLYVKGVGNSGKSAEEIVMSSYKNDITDEFILPSFIEENGMQIGKIEKGDAVLFFNFRSDRARELSIALTDNEFNEFETENLDLKYVTMTSYREDFNYENLFAKAKYENILGKVISDNNLSQLRIAETEKFAHITFFFNGGIDTPFPGEDRILVASPKVETYDLKPEMSAYEVTEKLLEQLKADDKYDLIILNLANCDMVGHTGIYNAAIKAVETVDKCVGEIVETALNNNYEVLLTADHGNSERMMENGLPFTAHTKNKVPFLITDDNIKLKNGSLSNISPTILSIMGIDKPAEMNEESLINID